MSPGYIEAVCRVMRYGKQFRYFSISLNTYREQLIQQIAARIAGIS